MGAPWEIGPDASPSGRFNESVTSSSSSAPAQCPMMVSPRLHRPIMEAPIDRAHRRFIGPGSVLIPHPADSSALRTVNRRLPLLGFFFLIPSSTLLAEQPGQGFACGGLCFGGAPGEVADVAEVGFDVAYHVLQVVGAEEVAHKEMAGFGF
jgi:hypothetical protein